MRIELPTARTCLSYAQISALEKGNVWPPWFKLVKFLFYRKNLPTYSQLDQGQYSQFQSLVTGGGSWNLGVKIVKTLTIVIILLLIVIILLLIMIILLLIVTIVSVIVLSVSGSKDCASERRCMLGRSSRCMLGSSCRCILGRSGRCILGRSTMCLLGNSRRYMLAGCLFPHETMNFVRRKFS